MPLTHYLCCFWPGLPELWFRGRWAALPLAIGFAIALNTLLIARFVYPEWLEPLMVRTVFWLFVVAWGVIFVRGAQALPMLLTPRQSSQREDVFDSARSDYLRGRWMEAEALLTECLEIDHRDAPALLLLASIYRKTERLDAARRSLDSLGSLESGDRWWLERELELGRLQRAAESDNEQGDSDDVPQASSSDENSTSDQIAAELAASMQFGDSDDSRS